ncbi:hypothetical protein [Kitasatospora albolonga]
MLTAAKEDRRLRPGGLPAGAWLDRMRKLPVLVRARPGAPARRG